MIFLNLSKKKKRRRYNCFVKLEHLNVTQGWKKKTETICRGQVEIFMQDTSELVALKLLIAAKLLTVGSFVTAHAWINNIGAIQGTNWVWVSQNKVRFTLGSLRVYDISMLQLLQHCNGVIYQYRVIFLLFLFCFSRRCYKSDQKPQPLSIGSSCQKGLWEFAGRHRGTDVAQGHVHLNGCPTILNYIKRRRRMNKIKPRSLGRQLVDEAVTNIMNL